MGLWYYYFTTFIFIFFLFIYFLFYLHFCPIFPHFFPFLPLLFSFVLHLNAIIFSFIPIGLLKILREERQDHPNYRQNSSPFSLCCCIIIIGLEKDNIRLYFSLPVPYLSFIGPTYPKPHEGLQYTHF